jgi:hypothetical protein
MNKITFPLFIFLCSLCWSGLDRCAIAQANSASPSPASSKPVETTPSAENRGSQNGSNAARSAPVSSVSVSAVTTSPRPSASTGAAVSLPKIRTDLLPDLMAASGVLHLFELLGLAIAVPKVFKLAKEHQEQQERITNLGRDLEGCRQSIKSQADQIKTMSTEMATNRTVLARVNTLESKSLNQPMQVGIAPSLAALSSADNNPASLPVTSRYPFLDLYHRSPDSFKQQYQPTAVSEAQENLEQRWAGNTQEIVLKEDPRGNYWLFQDGTTTYLLPSSKFKANEFNMRTAGNLFEHTGYYPNPNTTNVVRPVTVVLQPGADRRWKLDQKGALAFT